VFFGLPQAGQGIKTLQSRSWKIFLILKAVFLQENLRKQEIIKGWCKHQQGMEENMRIAKDYYSRNGSLCKAQQKFI
jgi:hypothetical protein